MANDHHISRQSAYTIAASANLRSDKEELVPDIRPADERNRLEWATMRANHDVQDYLYTDEVAFTIGDHSQGGLKRSDMQEGMLLVTRGE